MSRDPAQIQQDIEGTRERLGATAEAIGYKADVPSRVKENISDRVDDAKERLAAGAGAVKTKITSAVSGSADNVKRSVQGAKQLADDYPVATAIGVLAVGVLIGLLTPLTESEVGAMGPVAANLKETADGVARHVVEHGKQVAQETARAAGDALRRHASQAVSEIKEDGNQTV